MKFLLFFFNLSLLLLLSCGDTTDAAQSHSESSGVDTIIQQLSIPTTGYDAPDQYEGLSLVWSDEFRNGSLDTLSWNVDKGNGCPSLCGWGNNELEYYQKDNIYFRDKDYLIIQAREEQVDTFNYTSAKITTKDKRMFRYGRVDVRAALPQSQGIWPAIWMLGTNIDSVGWPTCGEIDIMEALGHEPDRIHGTFHYKPGSSGRGSSSQMQGLGTGDHISEAFHVFSLVWEENRMELLLDNEVYHRLTPDSVDTQSWPFNEHFYLILNVAVGGNWPGYPDSTTVLPQHMIVDYVRVYQ